MQDVRAFVKPNKCVYVHLTSSFCLAARVRGDSFGRRSGRLWSLPEEGDGSGCTCSLLVLPWVEDRWTRREGCIFKRLLGCVLIAAKNEWITWREWQMLYIYASENFTR